MIISKTLSVAAPCAVLIAGLLAQELSAQEKRKDTLIFPELVSTAIEGAPKLSAPVLLMGKDQPIAAGGLGWASPACWDWNRDGKKDLLVGEFGSGAEHGESTGNFIRVYENTGTDEAPQFAKAPYYARTIFVAEFEMKSPTDNYGNGTPMSIAQWCCQSFKPEFVDLNNDGLQDIVSGHYYPGDVSWFPAAQKGFLPGVLLEQADLSKMSEGKRVVAPNVSYYSSVSFGDFTGDGLQDMIFANNQYLRLSRNIGTAKAPKFGNRTVLLDPSGNKVLNQGNNIPTVTDWNRDGVLDVLTTGCFCNKDNAAVYFYKGVKTSSGQRFEQGIPLFIAKDGSKAFPGHYLNSYVTDWNNDGINDLLIGTNISIVNGKPDADLNWGFEFIKSSPGYNSAEYHRQMEERIRRADSLETALGKEKAQSLYEKNHSFQYMPKAEILKEGYGGKIEYKSLVHHGYVYLMLGRKP